MKVFKLSVLMEKIFLVDDTTTTEELYDRVSDLTEEYNLEGFDLELEEMPFETVENKVIH